MVFFYRLKDFFKNSAQLAMRPVEPLNQENGLTESNNLNIQ